MEVWEDMTPKNELWERIKKLKADNNQLQAESEKLKNKLYKSRNQTEHYKKELMKRGVIGTKGIA